MSGVIKIEIEETVDQLKQMLKSIDNQEVKERVQALYWLKTKQVTTIFEIAQLVGKHRTTVSRWLSLYRKGGIKTLCNKGKSTGRNSKLSLSVQQSLLQKLEEPDSFCNYKDLQQWLKESHNIEMSYTGVHQLVRYRLGKKLKFSRSGKKKSKPSNSSQ